LTSAAKDVAAAVVAAAAADTAAGRGGQRDVGGAVLVEVRHEGEHVADVVDARVSRLSQVVGRRGVDAAVLDGVIQLAGAAAEVVEDLTENGGELQVMQADGDRRVLIDAGRLEGLGLDDDVGAGDVAEEVDHIRETDRVEADFGELAVEDGFDFEVG